MTRSFIAMASAAIGGLLLFPAAARAQSGPLLAEPVVRVASVAPGSIAGVVHDESGQPVAGALVSALGATPSFAVTDHTGRFVLKTLSPGPYLVRARLSGFVTSRGQFVDVRPSGRTASSISLRHSAGNEPSRPVLAAGVSMPSPEPEPSDSTSSDSESDDSDDVGTVAWHLRRARRSVLRDATVPQDLMTDRSPTRPGLADRSFGTFARAATSVFASTPFSGQFNLLTTGSFNAPVQLLGADTFATGIASAAFGAPAGSKADWAVTAALGQGEIGSWMVAGSYAVRAPAQHRYAIGVSYAAQRYNVANPAALVGLAEAGRNAGTMYGYDTFVVTPSVSITYGARYDRYDYVASGGLASPRIGITVAPVGSKYRVTALASRRALAPGAEEFMHSADSRLWLPPQRVFSSLVADAPISAEFTNHLELGLEQDIARGTTLHVRVFRQRVTDQLVTLFGIERPGHSANELGHYFTARGGDNLTQGWSAGIRTVLGERVHGAVAYSLIGANWGSLPAPDYLVLVTPSAARVDREQIHDVSTSVETDVPETATRVVLLCRISNGFARPQLPAGFDTRFDVQVRQSLPFMNFGGTRWEALFAIRNFFHETASDQSVFDELLVVQPPKRVVGGLTLRF